MDALLEAARSYMNEEERLVLSWSQDGNNRKAAFGFPSCLLRHLHLFRVLMATSNKLPEDQVKHLPAVFFEFLFIYRGVLERTFSNFPAFGKELCLLFQCVAQVSMLLSDTTKSALQSRTAFQSLPDGRTHFRDSAVEAMVLQVILNVSENPLPKEWLADLPHSLRHQEKTGASRVVTIAEVSGSSWWVLDQFQVVKRRSRACNFEEWTEDL